MICFTLFIDKYSIYINIPCFMFRYIIRFVDGKNPTTVNKKINSR